MDADWLSEAGKIILLNRIAVEAMISRFALEVVSIIVTEHDLFNLQQPSLNNLTGVLEFPSFIMD